MADLAELEQRIAAALARISAGVDKLGAAAAADTDAPSAAQAEQIAHLQAALDAERAARAAADAALDDLQSPGPAAADAVAAAEIGRLTRQLDAQGLDNQRLRSSVAQLREELRRLRDAAEQAMADAPLVNRALQAELESLRAVRASETTEMADILAVLGRVIDAEEVRTHA